MVKSLQFRQEKFFMTNIHENIIVIIRVIILRIMRAVITQKVML